MPNKVLVIGESCIDIFVYGESKRKSPEGDAPVFLPLEEVFGQGMAANTKNNLLAMGLNVDTYFDFGSITKIRYVDKHTNKLYLRLDENDLVERIDLNHLPNLENYDAVIISDYCKGFLEEEDIMFISKKHPLVILDTKKKLGDWCEHMKFIKLNRTEYNNNKSNIEKYNLNSKIIATMDKDGAMYEGKMFPATTKDVIDICGAGDTFVAGFSKEYLQTKNIEKAIQFANEAAGFVVLNKGVSIYADLK